MPLLKHFNKINKIMINRILLSLQNYSLSYCHLNSIIYEQTFSLTIKNESLIIAKLHDDGVSMYDERPCSPRTTH